MGAGGRCCCWRLPRWRSAACCLRSCSDPYLLVAVQMFDGITAAVFSVMVPLIVADVAFGSGHFNLAQGIVGTATGIGASLSTVLAGYVSDKFGSSVAFTGLGRRRRPWPRDDLAGHAGDAAEAA